MEAAIEAGHIGMTFFKEADTDVWYKSGNSPVSEADTAIDRFLKERLLDQFPDHGWLSEETEDDLIRLDAERVFIIDPIDGTRGFLAGRPEWCVSIAIVENNRPVEGILHCPALAKTIHATRGAGLKVSGGASSAAQSRSRPVVTGSRKLIETIRDLPGQPFDVSEFIPSLAYRLSLVATGEIDSAFAWPGASEWDVAAADIILEEAGCCLVNKTGEPIRYNRRNTSLPSLIATSRESSDKILSLANSHGILH